MEWCYTTKRGSKYYVRETDGRWFVRADNVPNKHSRQWPTDYEVEIKPPNPRFWPYALGTQLFLESVDPNADMVMRFGYLKTSSIESVTVSE